MRFSVGVSPLSLLVSFETLQGELADFPEVCSKRGLKDRRCGGYLIATS